MYRTADTPTGYFRELGSIHVHVDAGASSEILSKIREVMTQSVSSDLKWKLNKVTRAVGGRQRYDDDHGASYASHTPGVGDEEDFGLFSTIGFGPYVAIPKELLDLIARFLESLQSAKGAVVESERVNGVIVDGKWREPPTALIPTITDKKLGWSRSYTSPIEIHHAIDFQKTSAVADRAPITPDELLPELENAGIILGGMFLFEKEKYWSLRTSQFANYDDYRDIALAHHVRLARLLRQNNLSARIWTITEQILGVWKPTGPTRDENVLYVPQLADWERTCCEEGDHFWVIAADFLGDVDPDVEDAMRDNLEQDVQYTYFVHSFADVQRLRRLTLSAQNFPGVGSRARDRVRAVLLTSSEDPGAIQHHLLAHDYFIANPHNLERAEGYELSRKRSGNIARGVRLRPQRLREIIELLNPLLSNRVQGTLLPPLRDRESSIKAVMFTDLENSTKWLRSIRHESGELLLKEYDNLVAYEISRARGRVLKALGDGYMCLFNSPSEAARCATRLQKALHFFNKTTHCESGIPPQRVALECGDLMLVERSHGDDVSGMPIARCARLLGLCRGGHVLMSRGFWDLAKDRLPWIEDESIFVHGEIELKGFDRQYITCLELLWTDSEGVRQTPQVLQNAAGSDSD